MDASSARRFMAHFPQVRVSNLYGPTEASIGCIHYEVPRDAEDPVPIGRPITGTTAIVVDEAGRPVPDGLVGELRLGGACVGLGYFGDPPREGARTFLTGDLARRSTSALASS